LPPVAIFAALLYRCRQLTRLSSAEVSGETAKIMRHFAYAPWRLSLR
jgi:hypothetical protein